MLIFFKEILQSHYLCINPEFTCPSRAHICGVYTHTHTRFFFSGRVFDTGSLCSPSCPRAHHVEQGTSNTQTHRDPLATASQPLGSGFAFYKGMAMQSQEEERILQFKPAFQLAGQGEVQHLKGGAQKQGLSQGTISRTASPAGWKSHYLAS